MVNPLDIYARATRRLPLTPAERALLRTFDQLLLSALAGAAIAVAQSLLDGGGQLNLASLGQVGLYAGATALLTGAAKLFRAHGDATSSAVASALDQAATRLPAPQGPLTSRMMYRGAPSGPLSDPQARAQLMATARQTLASNPELGAITRPVTSVGVPAPAADVTATQTVGIPTSVDTSTAQIASSARSTANQAEETPTDEATGDGPTSQQVTQTMAAMRAGATPADAWTN